MEQAHKSKGGRGKRRAARILPAFPPAGTLFQDRLLALGRGDGGTGSKNSSQWGDENGFSSVSLL